MKHTLRCISALVVLLWSAAIWAGSYTNTVKLFQNAGESAAYFNNSYGYAVFPTIGKAGLAVGAAHGRGRVYEHGHYVG
ncbi:MAG: hypothetical protein JO277_08315, partial [Candidatus Eremiobacteraeota bacterium]|nr:hypothetical protein [Candidatus Eremiobacteraeota bacterium]